MERRIARVNIGAAGGTAARGAKTCKVTLPTAWMDAMGITINQRELVLAFGWEPNHADPSVWWL